MWRLVCVPSPSGLGHLGREHKLLALEAKLAGQVEKNASRAGTTEAWLPWSWVFLHYAPTLSWKLLSHRTSVLGLEPRRCF